MTHIETAPQIPDESLTKQVGRQELIEGSQYFSTLGSAKIAENPQLNQWIGARYFEATTRTNDTIVVPVAWSDTVNTDFNVERLAEIARVTGARIIGLDFPGASDASTPITKHQIEQLRDRGEYGSVGATLVGALQSIAITMAHSQKIGTYSPGQYNIDESANDTLSRFGNIHLVGYSQGASSAVGMISGLIGNKRARKEISIGSINIIEPAALKRRSRLHNAARFTATALQMSATKRANKENGFTKPEINFSILRAYRRSVMASAKAFSKGKLAEELSLSLFDTRLRSKVANDGLWLANKPVRFIRGSKSFVSPALGQDTSSDIKHAASRHGALFESKEVKGKSHAFAENPEEYAAYIAELLFEKAS